MRRLAVHLPELFASADHASGCTPERRAGQTPVCARWGACPLGLRLLARGSGEAVRCESRPPLLEWVLHGGREHSAHRTPEATCPDSGGGGSGTVLLELTLEPCRQQPWRCVFPPVPGAPPPRPERGRELPAGTPHSGRPARSAPRRVCLSTRPRLRADGGSAAPGHTRHASSPAITVTRLARAPQCPSPLLVATQEPVPRLCWGKRVGPLVASAGFTGTLLSIRWLRGMLGGRGHLWLASP